MLSGDHFPCVQVQVTLEDMRDEVLLPGEPAQSGSFPIITELQRRREHVLPSQNVIKSVTVRKDTQWTYQTNGGCSCQIPYSLVDQVLL